jgi:hypothetical protein
MKIRNGFVSNSSSSSFILQLTPTKQNWGDTEAYVDFYYGYYKSRDELNKIFTNVFVDDDEDAYEYFYRINNKDFRCECPDYDKGCFFGIRGFTDKTEAKAELERILKVPLPDGIESFIAGSVST